ncbi:helix-turn-helix transcriptional regulator [Sphingosinicella sp. BN140058]|uniref:helix-turn-helix transcriptional regulator n=1 Tax=Sphingosinicella sp. BN140058 TaxID=1892855 RepID=UPI0013EA49E1|nr:helix-turn-helix transcriptional regulator [Sphingosinicella sp. BN140058]
MARISATADLSTPGGATAAAPRQPIPILRYSTDHLPEQRRYEEWLRRDWPRSEPIYRTERTEPFDTRWESVQLGPLIFVYTEITGMHWERRTEDIRSSDFDPIIVSMMIEGLAQGDLDGRAFREPAGTLHFHDLGRPSLHVSTASRTYAIVIPRPIAEDWIGPVHDLHGLVVQAEGAAMLFSQAEQTHRALPRLDSEAAERLGRIFLELIAIAAAEVRPGLPVAIGPEAALRRRAEEEIERRLGSANLTVALLCDKLGVSRARLFRAFQSEAGIHSYILRQRLERARAALADLARAEPVGTIAHRFGFSDPGHLSRSFRARFGMSPREYRRLVSTNSAGHTQANEAPHT